jgi:hypothetical protein
VGYAQGNDRRSTSSGFLVRVCVTCLGLGTAVGGMMIGVAQGWLWFESGRWLALSFLDLSEYLGLTSSRPSPFRPWHEMPNLVLLPLEAVPASVFLVVVGAVIVWATMPWEELASPPRARADLRKLKAAIRGRSVIVVARTELTVFEYLQRELAGNRQVALRLDRRWGERRHRVPPPGTGRRRADRRRPVEPERDLRFNPFFVAPVRARASGGLPSRATPAGPGLVGLLRSRLGRSWPAKRSSVAAPETAEPEAGPDPVLPLGFQLRLERRPPGDGQPASDARPARPADPVSEKDPPR